MQPSGKLVNPCRFGGYRDDEGRFIPFSHTDAAMWRAWEIGIRMLLRLELNEHGNLEGMLHSNERGLASDKTAGRGD
ncbi:MAG: hypothetical protein ACREV4_13575 [Gammaproteobacteria bacterium]